MSPKKRRARKPGEEAPASAGDASPLPGPPGDAGREAPGGGSGGGGLEDTTEIPPEDIRVVVEAAHAASEAAKAAGVPAATDVLDAEIRGLLARTERFVQPQPAVPPGPAAAERSNLAFEMPPGAEDAVLPSPPFLREEEGEEAGGEAGAKLGLFETPHRGYQDLPTGGFGPPKAKPPSAVAAEFDLPSMTAPLAQKRETTRLPAAGAGGGQTTRRMRVAAKRVGEALRPAAAAALDPRSPWLSVGIVAVAILWIATGLTTGSAAQILLGAAFLAPVVVAGAISR